MKKVPDFLPKRGQYKVMFSNIKLDIIMMNKVKKLGL